MMSILDTLDALTREKRRQAALERVFQVAMQVYCETPADQPIDPVLRNSLSAVLFAVVPIEAYDHTDPAPSAAEAHP